MNDEKKVGLARDYKKRVEDELTALCETVLGLLNDYLIPNATEPESKVSFLFSHFNSGKARFCAS